MPFSVGQPDYYTGQPPSNQIWQALKGCGVYVCHHDRVGHIATEVVTHVNKCLTTLFLKFITTSKTPIYTGTETDTHAHCIPGRVAGRNDLSYIVNSGKTHCK